MVLVQWLLLVGCATDLVSSTDVVSSTAELDQLEQRSQPTIVPPDAGIRTTTLMSAPAAIDPQLRAVETRDCYAPCPGPCALGEACCGSTQRCVRLDCPSCCPDPRFMFDAIRRATSKCCADR